MRKITTQDIADAVSDYVITLEQGCTMLYSVHGQYAVYELCNMLDAEYGFTIGRAYCEPCEDDVPVGDDGCCLVCGTSTYAPAFGGGLEV